MNDFPSQPESGRDRSNSQESEQLVSKDQGLAEKLSAHLDGVLDVVQTAELMTLLRNDSAAAAQWESMQRQRDQLREIYQSDSPIRLPKTFADQVVDAAIDRARGEGCGDQHPLILASDCPTGVVSLAGHSKSNRTMKRIATIVGLAASIIFAALWIPCN